MTFTENKLDIFDYLGGSHLIDLHPTESLVVYDGGSSVLLWELKEDIKLRVHEHSNPVQVVKFFGEDSRFILSSDYRTIIISEWHSLKRVAELTIPMKKIDSPQGLMMLDYQDNCMVMLTQLRSGYRLSILSFKEFSLRFIFSADLPESGRPLLLRLAKYDDEYRILVVEENCVKLWQIEETTLICKDQVAVHKPVISACYLQGPKEVVILTEEGLLVSLNKKVSVSHTARVSLQIAGQ